MPKLPFVHTPKLRHVAIGNENSGIIWMIEKGGISPAESPVDVMVERSNQMKQAKIFKKVQERLASARRITISEAKALLFGMKVKQADDEKLQVEIDDEVVSWDDWLEDEEVDQLFQLQGSQESFEIRTATLMIRHRVLYPIGLSGPANPESKTLSVKPLAFKVNAGDVIDFEAFKITAAAFADEGAEIVEVEKIPGKLKAETYGFLLQSPGKKKAGVFNDQITPAVFEILVGALQETGLSRVEAETKATEYQREKDLNSGWTEADTRQLDPGLIHDIYRLYCREMKLPDPDLPVNEAPELEGGDDAPLEKTSTTRSTGTKSTADSNSLELATVG